MRHAGAAALSGLEVLLASLRARTALREKRPGIFYVKSRAFLHFHEDKNGLFVDLRQGGEWRRLAADGPEDWARLLDDVDRTLRGADDSG